MREGLAAGHAAHRTRQNRGRLFGNNPTCDSMRSTSGRLQTTD